MLAYCQRRREGRILVKISACVIVKNEAENLPRWLESAQEFADEMIVVDTGSSDGTAAIAAQAGAKVYSFQWMDDFSAAKNFALDQATGDWIVFTDADEYFTEESIPRVRPLIATYDKQEKINGFFVHLINIDMDTGALLGTSAEVLRIFRNAPWLRFIGNIHEHVENFKQDPDSEMIFAPNLTIYHTGYSPRIIKKKAARNLALICARRAAGDIQTLDAYHLMDCYFSLEDYPKTEQYARAAISNPHRPTGSEERPYLILLNTLILMGRGADEIEEVYRSAQKAFPQKADFPMIYGLYAWDQQHLKSAYEAYAEGIRLDEEYYRAGDFSATLLPNAYACLGEIAALRGEMEAAVDFFLKSLQGNKYQNTVLSVFFRVLYQMGADDAVLISFLNGLYQRDSDAPFLTGVLIGSAFSRTCLYYERYSEKKLPPRRRALLAGDVRAAAASLVEDMERSAALAMAYGGAVSQEIQGAFVLLLPQSCRGNRSGDRRMERRAARLEEGKA